MARLPSGRISSNQEKPETESNISAGGKAFRRFPEGFLRKNSRERVVGITHESYLGNRYENPLFDSGVHLCDSGGADLCLPLCQRSPGNAGDRRVGFFERSAVAAGQ